MKATVLLADSAQELGGKIYALGVGWSQVGTPTPPHSVIIFVDVDWTETNRRFNLRAELLNSDGEQVVATTDFGEQPLFIEMEAEVGRPAGMPHGTPVRFPITAGFGPLNLQPGARYEWRVTINGEHDEHWSESFTVRPQ